MAGVSTVALVFTGVVGGGGAAARAGPASAINIISDHRVRLLYRWFRIVVALPGAAPSAAAGPAALRRFGRDFVALTPRNLRRMSHLTWDMTRAGRFIEVAD